MLLATSRYFTNVVGVQQGGLQFGVWAGCQNENMNKKQSLFPQHEVTLKTGICAQKCFSGAAYWQAVVVTLGNISVIFTVTVEQRNRQQQ